MILEVAYFLGHPVHYTSNDRRLEYNNICTIVVVIIMVINNNV